MFQGPGFLGFVTGTAGSALQKESGAELRACFQGSQMGPP